MSLIGSDGDLITFTPNLIPRTNTPGTYLDLVTEHESSPVAAGCSSCAYDPSAIPRSPQIPGDLRPRRAAPRELVARVEMRRSRFRRALRQSRGSATMKFCRAQSYWSRIADHAGFWTQIGFDAIPQAEKPGKFRNIRPFVAVQLLPRPIDRGR